MAAFGKNVFHNDVKSSLGELHVELVEFKVLTVLTRDFKINTLEKLGCTMSLK